MNNIKPEQTRKEAKASQIIQVEQEQLSRHLKKVIRGTVEQMLNGLLEAEAEQFCQAGRCEPNGITQRHCCRALHAQFGYQSK